MSRLNYLFWLIFAVFCSGAFSEKSKLLDNEIGPQNVAFSGGGYSEESGLHSLFTNPAGLRTPTGLDVSLGAYNLSHGFYPIASFGQNVSRKTSYALGYFFNESRSRDSLHQGVVAGFSITPLPMISLGTVVFTQMVGEETGVDMNVGLQYSHQNMLRAGLTVKSINEARIGEADSDFKGSRKYAASLGTLYDYPVSGYYDIISDNILFEKARHVLSFKGRLGSEYNISGINSYALNTEDDMQLSTSLGVQLSFRSMGSVLGINYAIGDLPLMNSDKGVVQTFNLNVRFSSFYDRNPPIVFVKETIGKIAPTGDSSIQNAYFHLFAEDQESDLDKWYFVICSTNKLMGAEKSVRHLAGRGLPPKVIRWNGRDSSRELLKPGIYTYRLVVTDMAGNIAKTKWQLIEVDE